LTIWCEALDRKGALDDCVACRTDAASVELVKHVIQCPGLVGLTLGLLLTESAVRSVHADFANPFERLRHLQVHVQPKALPMLCGMIRNVTNLRLQIGLVALVTSKRPGIFSTVSRLYYLRALAIGGCYERDYKDFRLLGRLVHLQKLEIDDLSSKGSVSCLTALLTQQHHLQSLQIAGHHGLSTSAYHVVANNCPELRHLALSENLRLHSPEAATSGPHFPKLEELEVRKIVVDGGLERYASSLCTLTFVSLHSFGHNVKKQQVTD
jgi:hypothetical protein